MIFAIIAMTPADKKTTIFFHLDNLLKYAMIVPRASKDISDLNPLHTSSTITCVCGIFITLPSKIVLMPIALIILFAHTAANIFILNVIPTIAIKGNGIMNNRNNIENKDSLNISHPLKYKTTPLITSKDEKADVK